MRGESHRTIDDGSSNLAIKFSKLHERVRRVCLPSTDVNIRLRCVCSTVLTRTIPFSAQLLRRDNEDLLGI